MISSPRCNSPLTFTDTYCLCPHATLQLFRMRHVLSLQRSIRLGHPKADASQVSTDPLSFEKVVLRTLTLPCIVPLSESRGRYKSSLATHFQSWHQRLDTAVRHPKPTFCKARSNPRQYLPTTSGNDAYLQCPYAPPPSNEHAPTASTHDNLTTQSSLHPILPV